MRRRVHQGWTEGSGRLLCIDSTILTGALHAHGGHLNSQAGHPAKCYPACCAGRLRLACLVSTWLAAQRHTQLCVHLKAHTEKTRWKKPSGMPHPHEHGERVFLPYQVLPHLPRLEPWQHLHTRACGHKGNRAFSVWQDGVQGPCKSGRAGQQGIAWQSAGRQPSSSNGTHQYRRQLPSIQLACPQRAQQRVDDAMHVVQRQGVQDAVVRLPLPGVAKCVDHGQQAGMRVQRACRVVQHAELKSSSVGWGKRDQRGWQAAACAAAELRPVESNNVSSSEFRVEEASGAEAEQALSPPVHEHQQLTLWPPCGATRVDDERPILWLLPLQPLRHCRFQCCVLLPCVLLLLH